MKPLIRHGCLASVILLSGASFWLDPAAAEILFKADFETGDFSQFSGKSKNIKPGHIEVVTDIVHSGKYAGRFTIHQDNVFNARQLRVQANGPKVTVKEGSDTFVSFYMYMNDPPKDRDNFFYWEGSPPPRYNNVMTWWVEPKKGGAGTSIKFGTGNLGRKGVHWEGDFTVGRWHQLGMHIHWSEDPARGNVKLWWDGAVVLDKKVETKGPQSVYFSQPGIHRDPHTKSEDTIYFDDFLCATTLEEIGIQPPTTATSKEPSPPRFKAVAFDYFVIFDPNSSSPLSRQPTRAGAPNSPRRGAPSSSSTASCAPSRTAMRVEHGKMLADPVLPSGGPFNYPQLPLVRVPSAGVQNLSASCRAGQEG